MADPFSIIASTIGACDVILRSILAIGKYASDVKGAANSWSRIKTEIENLYDITAALHKFLESRREREKPFDETVPITLSVKKCQLFITELEHEFIETKKKGALRWPFSQKKMEKILSDLDRFINLFHYALGINGWA